jgi:hypothetical protein
MRREGRNADCKMAQRNLGSLRRRSRVNQWLDHVLRTRCDAARELHNDKKSYQRTRPYKPNPDLNGLGFDMAMTGFSIGELNSLVPAAAGLTEDDAVPAPPDTPVTVLGDCWLLGPHPVLCSDSTSVDAEARLCAPGLANLVFTDPPYNVDYEGYTEENQNECSSRFKVVHEPGVGRPLWLAFK